MEIRRIEPGDRAALERFLDEIPEADRTFLKEDVADPDVVAAWVLPGDARSIALDGGDVVGYVAVIPLHGWSRHVGEVRIVVDPDHRGRGVGQALARHAVLEALELGRRQAGRRGDRRPGGADRHVRRARLRARGAADRPRARPVGRAARPARARPLGGGAVGVDGRGGHRRRAAECSRRRPQLEHVWSTLRAISWRPRSARGAARPPASTRTRPRSARPPRRRSASRRRCHLQPARSIVALFADLTRDVGAVQVSARALDPRRMSDASGMATALRRAHAPVLGEHGRGGPRSAHHGARAERRRVVADRAGALASPARDHVRQPRRRTLERAQPRLHDRGAGRRRRVGPRRRGPRSRARLRHSRWGAWSPSSSRCATRSACARWCSARRTRAGRGRCAPTRR